MSAIVIFALFILLLHLILPKKYHSLIFEWKISKISGPLRVPYFGNLSVFTLKPEDVVGYIAKNYNQYKPHLHKVDILGRILVTVKDLDDLKIIFNSMDFITKSDDYKFLEPWLGTGLITSTGQKWHSHRKLIAPAFHFKILGQYMDTLNQNANVLVAKLMSEVENDSVDINKLMTLCTLDIICETAMGVKIGAQKGGEKEYVKAILKMVRFHQIRLLHPWLQTDWVFNLFPSGREQKRLLKIVNEFNDKVIKERTAVYRQKKKNQTHDNDDLQLGQKIKKSFLDLLIEISETQNNFTEKDIRDEVNTIMFAGSDTSSVSLAWVVYLLGCHPEIQEKAYQELQEIFGVSNRNPTFADLAEMKYLERIIKEGLRLYPSVPFLARKVEVDVKMRDNIIPAGANILIPIYCIHRDEKYYPDPTKFDPDRFLAEAISDRHPFSYIPFSPGLRKCIGHRFAMIIEKVILSHVLRKFKITSFDSPENIKLLAELTLRPKDRLRIAFKRR